MPHAPPPSPASGLTLWRSVLLQNPFFAPMRAGELDELIAMSSERRVAKAALVFSKGDPGSFMITVLQGRLRVLSTSRDGREVTLNIVAPGEVVGQISLLDGKPRSADAVAVEETIMMVTERRYFLPFLEAHPDFALRLLLVLCGRLRKAFGALEDIALFDLPARLARLLLELAETQGEATAAGTRISGRLSQRELANLVFSSRESVNKQLRIWREAGVLTTASGHIIILDPASLQGTFEI